MQGHQISSQLLSETQTTKSVPGLLSRHANLLLLLSLLVLPTAAFAQADSVSPATPNETVPAEDSNSDAVASQAIQNLLNALQQPAEDLPEAIPSKPLSPEESSRRTSLSYYMSGRSFEYQKKYAEAYDAYQRALELAPQSAAIYRALIPLAFRLDKAEEGVQLAQKAVELDPQNFELLSQLGIYALRNKDLSSSIEYFQKAVQSETVDKKSGPFISILSQLAQLYLSIGDNERAAAAYVTVFDALQNSQAYGLDYRTLQALENLRGNKAATYESFGELFLLTGRYDLAYSAFEQAQKSGRGNPALYNYQLARVLNKQEKYAAAVVQLQPYFKAKLEDKGRAPYLLLAEILNAQQLGDEITGQIEKLAEADPLNEALQLYLAERYIADDELEKSLAIYELYGEKGKSQGEIQLGLLQIYRKQNKPEQALSALSQSMMAGVNTDRLEAEMEVLAQSPELTDKMIELGLSRNEEGDQREIFAQSYLLGKLSMQRKNYTAVIDFYQRAMEIRKEQQFLLTLYGELIEFLAVEEQYELCETVLEEAIDNPALSAQRQALQLQLIRVLAQNEKIDAALEIVSGVQESDPDNLLWEFQKGWIHYTNRQWKQAIDIFEPVLEKAVSESNQGIEREVRYNLSRALAFAGQAEAAIQLLEKSITAEPEELLWKFQKAWIYYVIHDWPNAITGFKDLVENHAEENASLIRQAKFSLSAAYVQNDQLDEGERILEQVYLADTEDISVCNDLGYLYADRGKKLEQAYLMVKKAIDADPENNAYIDSMGWVLFRMGKLEEAREYLEKAVENSEEGDAILWDHLGDCYAALGLTENAVSAWKKALEREQQEQYSDQKLIDKIELKLKSDSSN